MSDSFFDADRAAGLYPPKLWGWQSEDYQRKYLLWKLEHNEWEQWMEAYKHLIDGAEIDINE